jgi:hypothetical protein
MSMRTIGLRLLQTAHQASLASGRRRFHDAAAHCEAAQLTRLRTLASANAASSYGRAHGFDRITSVRDWQDRVPVVGYDELEPWIARAAKGEPGVLTVAPVLAFERTSGSTSASKLIPYTAALLEEFSAATAPWLDDLYSSFPTLKGTTSYWSISPVTRGAERTAGNIPIGFDDDTEYFGRLERFALRRMMAVPSVVARASDFETWAGATVRHLVADGDLGLISVWHPSFFTLLLDRIKRDLDNLIRQVPARRAKAIRERLDRCGLGQALWPRLTLVSCWADASAANSVPALAGALPHAHLQPKGLLATEGVVSFPLQRDGRSVNVAAVAGHFLEFEDLDRPTSRCRLAHELVPGASYAPVISTAGGFYRYRLGDAVQCTGFVGQAPTLRFDGRIDQVSDLCGEKINPRMVAAALARAQQTAGVSLTFALLAPVRSDPPHYCLYAEGPDGATLRIIRDELERLLSQNHGYQYARALGQLGPLGAIAVRDGAARYVRARADAGQRAGSVKPAQLDATLEWSRVFVHETEGIAEPLVM